MDRVELGFFEERRDDDERLLEPFEEDDRLGLGAVRPLARGDGFTAGLTLRSGTERRAGFECLGDSERGASALVV